MMQIGGIGLVVHSRKEWKNQEKEVKRVVSKKSTKLFKIISQYEKRNFDLS